MTNPEELASNLAKRWAALSHAPRKKEPRIYRQLDDAQLTEKLRQTNQTLAITANVDPKRFDSSAEAQRIRAMSSDERGAVRKEALAVATAIRDEFRRRMTLAGPSTRE